MLIYDSSIPPNNKPYFKNTYISTLLAVLFS